MQHMVSLVQLGVLRSVRAGGELHCLEVYLHVPFTPYCRDSQLPDINNNTTMKIAFKSAGLLLRIWEVLAALPFSQTELPVALPSPCRRCRDCIANYPGSFTSLCFPVLRSLNILSLYAL